MTGISALVVDDEPLARRRMRRLLKLESWIGDVDEAGDIEQASRKIEARRPDILLLDIHMPGGSGFELLEHVGDRRPPAIIFVTAYDDHALQGFEVNAVDYVTKPVDPLRLVEALNRARKMMSGDVLREQVTQLADTVNSLERKLKLQEKVSSGFWVRNHGELLKVPLESVLSFRADRDYAYMQTDKGVHHYTEGLASLERRLDPEKFKRIHRSVIVRCDAIRSIRVDALGSLAVIMSDGSELRVGRKYTPAIREWMALSNW